MRLEHPSIVRDSRRLERKLEPSIAAVLRDGGIDEARVRQICRIGGIELASVLRQYSGVDIDLAGEASRFAMNGPQRGVVLKEMRSLLGARKIKPTHLHRYLMMAEICGSISDLRDGISAARRLFDAPSREFFADTGQLRSWLRLAQALYDIDLLESTPIDDGSRDIVEPFLISTQQYRKFCIDQELDYRSPHKFFSELSEGRQVKLHRPTVIFRPFVQMFERLMPDWQRVQPLRLLPIARDMGFDIQIYPQIVNPGPAYAAPFDLNDPNLVAMVSVHKFSDTLHPKLIHYRSYLKGSLLLDHGGYSGWMRPPSLAKVMRDVATSPVTSFCDKERAEIFSAGWPDAIPRDKPYLFIPLQMEGDSVRDLAFCSPEVMVAACYRHFYRRGWNIVLKRHPKDRFFLTERLVAEAAQLPGVFVASDPSPTLVNHSSAVAVVNSSVGWEAVLASKPILAFGRSEYRPVTTEIHTEVDFERFDASQTAERRRICDAYYYHFFHFQACQSYLEVENRFRATLIALQAGKSPPYFPVMPDTIEEPF